MGLIITLSCVPMVVASYGSHCEYDMLVLNIL